MYIDPDEIEHYTGNLTIDTAIAIAICWGGIDGGHHKAWVIDQMVKTLAGNHYERVVADAKNGEDGPDTYEWVGDQGIPP